MASAYWPSSRAMPKSAMMVKLPPRVCMRETFVPAGMVNLLPYGTITASTSRERTRLRSVVEDIAEEVVRSG